MKSIFEKLSIYIGPKTFLACHVILYNLVKNIDVESAYDNFGPFVRRFFSKKLATLSGTASVWDFVAAMSR